MDYKYWAVIKMLHTVCNIPHWITGCEEAHLSLKQFHFWLTLIERQTEPNKLCKKPELFLFSPFYILFFGDVCYLVSVPVPHQHLLKHACFSAFSARLISTLWKQRSSLLCCQEKYMCLLIEDVFNEKVTFDILSSSEGRISSYTLLFRNIHF